LKDSEISEIILFNKKIFFLEKLLAENITEAELMRKYYFSLFSSNKNKGRIGDFSKIRYHTLN
jgi:hypothetical protein